MRSAVWNRFGFCKRDFALINKATLSYMIKPHGSLVSVSSALLRYTPDLSTT